MSDIEKIIKKHKANLLELLPGGGHFRSNQHVASALEAAVREAVEAERGRMMNVCTRIYNAGYQAGHHYTVEGGFYPIHHSDQDTYHEDEVRELLDEILPTTDSEGAG